MIMSREIVTFEVEMKYLSSRNWTIADWAVDENDAVVLYDKMVTEYGQAEKPKIVRLVKRTTTVREEVIRTSE